MQDIPYKVPLLQSGPVIGIHLNCVCFYKLEYYTNDTSLLPETIVDLQLTIKVGIFQVEQIACEIKSRQRLCSFTNESQETVPNCIIS